MDFIQAILSVFGKNRTEIAMATFTTVGGAAAAGDAISDSTSAPTAYLIPVPTKNFVGIIDSIILSTDDKGATNQFRLLIYSKAKTNLLDNALGIIDNDITNLVGVIDFAAQVSGSDTTNSAGSYATVRNLQLPIAVDGDNIGIRIFTIDAKTLAVGAKISVKLLMRTA